MPEVKLISYTGHGHPDPLYAARLLAYTKNTRLQMTPDGLNEWMHKPESEILDELAYMAKTIPSSWEFVDLTFAISKVSRATAQQITRTRTASFAMQSQRVTDMRSVTWDKVGEEMQTREMHDIRMQDAIASYTGAVEEGMSLEDARDLLPIGVHCNLIAKYNLRSLVDLVRARDSMRVQGAYKSVAKQMKAETIRVWPWAEVFFEHPHDKAFKMLEEVADQLAEKGAVYKGPAGDIAKAIDLLKKG